MKGKSFFTSDNIYYAKFDNVDGLEQSNPVSINGLKVGQVDKILPQTAKDGTIYFVVKVLVDKGFNFSKNSTVEIFEQELCLVNKHEFIWFMIKHLLLKMETL